jgi:hypothetical protein
MRRQEQQQVLELHAPARLAVAPRARSASPPTASGGALAVEQVDDQRHAPRSAADSSAG